MMRAEYRKELSHNYMILCEKGNEAEESYQLKTIYSNRIEGLLPLAVEYRDEEIRCRYEITSLQSFAVCCESLNVTADDLRRIYIGILDLLSTMEDYLLDPDHLLLDPEYLYIEWNTRRVKAAYLPDEKHSVREKLILLTEYLISKAGFRDRRSVLLLCAILNELKGGSSQIADLRTVLSSDYEDGVKTETGTSRPGQADVLGGFVRPDPVAFEDQRYGAFPEEDGKDGLTSISEDGLIKDGIPDAWNEAAGVHSRGTDPRGQKGSGKRKKKADVLGWMEEMIPEKYTVLMALLMAAASAVVWAALRLQTLYRLSAAETVFGSALGAALILACAGITGKAAGRRTGNAYPAYMTQGVDYTDETDAYETGSGEYLYGDLMNPVFRFGGGTDGVRDTDPEAPAPRFRPAESFFSWTDENDRPDGDEGTDGQTVLLEELRGGRGGIPASMTPSDSGSGLPPFVLEDRDLLIGKKKPQADRVIPDPAVSRIHARISRRGGRYTICDMGSKNGTAVNGRPLVGREEAMLSDGDVVMFAGCSYVFHEGSA